MAAKLLVKLQKLFGSTAGPQDIGKFGSFAAGTPEFTTNPDLIQQLSNFLDGWKGAIVGAQSPAIEDVNAVDFLYAYQLAYLQQQGICEYMATREYFTGSVVTNGLGAIYISRTDNNLGNSLNDTANWWAIRDVTGRIFTVDDAYLYEAGTGGSPSYISRKSRGTLAVPTVVIPGDIILGEDEQAYLGGTFTTIFQRVLTYVDDAPDVLFRIEEKMQKSDFTGLETVAKTERVGAGLANLVQTFYGPVVVGGNTTADVNLGTITSVHLDKVYRGEFQIVFNVGFFGSNSVYVTFSKVNNQVTMRLEQLTAPTGGGANTELRTTASIPTGLKPSANVSGLILINDDGALGAGVLTIDATTGRLIVTKADGSNFATSGANVGWQTDAVITYFAT